MTQTDLDFKLLLLFNVMELCENYRMKLELMQMIFSSIIFTQQALENCIIKNLLNLQIIYSNCRRRIHLF